MIDEWVSSRVLEVLQINDTSHNAKVCLWSKATHERWQREQESIKLSWQWQEFWQDSEFDFTHRQVDVLFVRLIDSKHPPFRIKGLRMIKRWIRMARKEGIRVGKQEGIAEGYIVLP